MTGSFHNLKKIEVFKFTSQWHWKPEIMLVNSKEYHIENEWYKMFLMKIDFIKRPIFAQLLISWN